MEDGYKAHFIDRNGCRIELGTNVVTDAPNNKTIGCVSEISFLSDGRTMVRVGEGFARVNSAYVSAYTINEDERAVSELLSENGIRVKPEAVCGITKKLKELFANGACDGNVEKNEVTM